MSTREYEECHGEIVYNQRNYNVKDYTFKNYRAKAISNYTLADLIKQSAFAKIMCLREAGKDDEQTMLSVERDEDYYPEFKQCVQ